MNMGVRRKLFLAFLLTNVAVIVIMAASVGWSFRRGFMDYIQEVDAQRLETLVQALTSAYGEHGSWQFLRDNHRRWHELLIGSRPWARRPRQSGPEVSEGRRREHHEGRPERRPEDVLRAAPRLTLLDAERRPVAGNPHPLPGSTLYPIEAAGETVGWLSVAPLKILTDRLDVRFEAQQFRAYVIIAALSVLLAALVAVVLARALLAPVKDLASGTRALIAGRFATRIRVSSRDELGQLSSDFNTLATTLESNQRLRNQFMADISHELRTPLAVLRAEIEAVQDGVRLPDGATLKSLHAEVLRLSKLVDQLYELSLYDIGALTYRRERVDLAQVLDEALDSYREQFGRRGIRLTTNLEARGPVQVLADAGRLSQLFANLLENSLRYTDAGGELQVTLARGDSAARVHFQDSPPGVPEAVLGRLFERLYRVEASRDRAQGGAGLGLAICRNIVAAHHGEIIARASPLGGLWIEVVLPIEP